MMQKILAAKDVLEEFAILMQNDADVHPEPPEVPRVPREPEPPTPGPSDAIICHAIRDGIEFFGLFAKPQRPANIAPQLGNCGAASMMWLAAPS